MWTESSFFKRFNEQYFSGRLPEYSIRVIEARLGEECQVDYGTGPMVRDPDSGKYRDLTRSRIKLVQGRSVVANCIQKVLEDANIKLASVASDFLGHSGCAMLDVMISGQANLEILAEMVLDAMECRDPMQRYAATWVRSGTLLICRPVKNYPAGSMLFTHE